MTLELLSIESSGQDAQTSQLVPISLLHVRTFLFEHGMPIVPWASAAEVLNDFLQLLEAQQHNDVFWQSLRKLLDELNINLKGRLCDDAQANEVLALTAREVLLDEVRHCLGIIPERQGGFVNFARTLSQNCLAIVLLLGAAATVSCGAQADTSSSPQSNNDVGGANGTGGSGGTGGSSGSGGKSAYAPTGGNGFIINTVATGGNPNVNTNGTVACNDVTSGAGEVPPLSMDDVRAIANQCIVAGSTRDGVLSCLDTLNASWQTGMEAVLNCKDCGTAAQYLTKLLSNCSNLPNGYDSCLVTQCAVLVYMGVRMG